MAARVLPIESVNSNPAVRGGQPVISGTTLRVSELAASHTLAGLTGEQLSVQFELDLARVHVGTEISCNVDQIERLRPTTRRPGQASSAGTLYRVS